MKFSIRHLFRTALAGTAASFIHLYQHEAHTIWIVISTLFVIQVPEVKSRIEIIEIAIDRIIATGIGVSLGLIGYGLIYYNVKDGNVEIAGIIIFIIFMITDFFQQITKSLTIINITAALIMLLSIQSNAAFDHALSRSLDIIYGAIIGLSCIILIPPHKKVT
ncbi:MAG: FUSC family protein [Pseudomonadota bacterium]|nr:FUSC family protein [Pseudomonadota bacterium]